MTQKSICLTPLRVVPGARLARPALRPDGKLLLAAGTVLDREQLAQLFQRGVEYLHVEFEDSRDGEAIARDIAATEARIAHLFRGAGGEAREELRAAVAAYRRQGVE